MNTPTVTFLIPCYNVSSCVEHCLQSVLRPSILEDIEVLAINDGSKDNTLEVLRRYEQQHPTTVRVIDKVNGGWGTGINLGIREAKGKYLKELDADDWVETEQLEEYIENLKNLDVDYIATDYKEYWAKEDKYIPHTYQKEIYRKIQGIDEFWDSLPDAWDFPIHAITYRTQFLKDINLTVGDRYYADLEYLIYPATQAKSITALPLTITIYYRGSDEQSTSTAGYAKHYKDYVALSMRLISYLDKLPKLQPTFDHFIKGSIYGTATRAYYLMMSPLYAAQQPDSKEELKKFDNWLKENNKDIYDYCGKEKRHRVPYIKFWRIFGINILRLIRVTR